MKVVVTGANGYIGSELTSRLLGMGIDVVALDIDNSNLDKKAEFIKANIFEGFPKELFENTDALIHLAWRNGFNHNHPSHLEDLHKHFFFLKNVIEAGCNNISVLGTMHEVGYYEGKMDERVACNPMSLYGIAKNALRQSLECYLKNKNVIFHWLRAFYIVGNDIKSNSVFGKLMRASLAGEKEFPFNSGKNQYDFINLEDLSKQIAAASLQKDITGIINLCSGVPVSLGDKMDEFIRKNNLNISLKYGAFPDREYDSPVIYGDNTKIKAIFSNGVGV